MSTLPKIRAALNRLIVVAAKAVAVVLILAYGGTIFFGRVSGLRVGNYRIAQVFQFDRIAISMDDTRWIAENGSLVTARRDGEENYVAILGSIRAVWPERIRKWPASPPEELRELRISLNPADLQRWIDENREALREPLEFEVAAMQSREAAEKIFDRPADAGLRPPLLPRLDLFRPPPLGSVDVAIPDPEWGGRPGGYELSIGPRPTREQRRSNIGFVGLSGSLLLLALAAPLAALLAASVLVAIAAQAAEWATTWARHLRGLFKLSVRDLFKALWVMLLLGSLLSILSIL